MEEKKNRTSNGYSPNATSVHEIITCRRILNIVVFIGFMVNYMLRVNLTFAIVDMVSKPVKSQSNNTVNVTTDEPVSNRSVRSAYAFVTENGLRQAQISSFLQLETDDENEKNRPEATSGGPSSPELDSEEGVSGRGSLLDDLDDSKIPNGRRSLISSRNLVAEDELQESAKSTASPSANETNSNDTDSGLETGNFQTTEYAQVGYIDRVRRFDWSESQQGYLIGCFFWGYICTEIPGGRLAEIYGARKVFGYATLGATVLTLLTPLAAKIDFIVLLACRVLLGFCLGPTWPAVLPLAGNWIPPDERGKFLSNMMASTLGAGFTLPICGFIIATFSWEFVFYITGMISLLWSIAWFLLVYDSPATHPRISVDERRYIESKLGLKSSKPDVEESQVVQRLMTGRKNSKDASDSDASDTDNRSPNGHKGDYSVVPQNDCQNCVNGKYKKKKYEPTSDGETHVLQPLNSPVIQICNQSSISLSNKGEKPDKKQQSGSGHGNAPWLHIITSVPVWAFVLTHGASVFGYFTITNQLPTYMKYILHYNIKENGVLSGLPYIGKYVSALIGGSIADYLLKSSILSREVVRKLFTFIGVMLPGFIMIVQVFLGSDKILSIIIFVLALVANGFVTGGYLGNSLELAPNYSGTIFGLANMFSGFSGTLSALLVGYLTDHNQVYGQWQKVFAVVAGVYIFGATLFLFLGSTKTQSWNSKKESSSVKKTRTNGANV